MADRYLLESGAPDGYQLEDGSGVYLLEAADSYTAPTRRSSTSTTGTGTNVGGTPGNYTAAITLNKPSGVVDGDLLFTVISTDGNAVGLVQTLSGWTPMSFNPLRPTTDGQRVYVFYRVASSEGASWTWSTDTNNGNDWTGQVVAYYGQGATWAVDTAHSTVDSTSNSSPVSVSDSGVTTTIPNTLLLYIGAGDPNANNSGSWSDPSGYTAGAQSYANYAPLMFADKVQAAAGASGSVAGTLTFAAGAAGFAAAVIPIAGTASGGGAAEGSGAPALPILTASGSGKKARAGSGTPTLPIVTASGTGKKARHGTGSATLPALTASGTGKKARKGSGAAVLPILAAAGSGSSANVSVGSGAATLPALTASGSGKKSRSGTGADSLPLLTAAGSGKKSRSGSGAPVLPILAAAGTGSSSGAAATGSGAASLPLLTASGSGRKARAGTGAATLPALTGSGSGKKARAGSGSATLPALQASGAAHKARSGVGAATLPLLTAAGSGVSGAPQEHNGSGALTLPALTASGRGPVGGAAGATKRRPLRPWLQPQYAPTRLPAVAAGIGALPMLTASGTGSTRRDPFYTDEELAALVAEL